jgi:DNA-binding transcriptional regulator YhcF (GntR family)
MSRIPSPEHTVNDLESNELEPLEPDTLLIENEALRKGFTVIPNFILRNPSLSIGARMMYTLLLSYAWQEGSCFPGQKRIARELGIKERMVRYYLTELQNSGFVEAKRRGLGKTNIYVLKDKEDPDRQNIAGLDRQPITSPERQNVADEENTVQNDTINNNSGGEDATDVAVSLERVGVDKKASQRLIEHYSPDRIRQKIDYYDYEDATNPGKIKNPAAYVRKAIEEDWGPPTGYKSKAQREAEQAQIEERRQRLAAAGAVPERVWRTWMIEDRQVPDDLVSLTDQLVEALQANLSPGDYARIADSVLVTNVSDSLANIAVESSGVLKLCAPSLVDESASVLTALLGRPVSVSLEVHEKPFDAL